MTLFLLLPAYNEAENIPELFGKIRSCAQSIQHPVKIILVDDGSSDHTSDTATNASSGLDLILVTHAQNRGLAETLRTGFKKILSIGQSEDVIVVMDADNSHDPQLIPSMMEQLSISGNGVIASRYKIGGREAGLSSYRKALSYGCNFLLRVLFPIRGVLDYTCGYRLFKFSWLETLGRKTSQKFFKAESFVCTSELLINLVRSGAAFTEIPLILRYDLKKGRSKMRVLRTILGYLGLFLRRKG